MNKLLLVLFTTLLIASAVTLFLLFYLRATTKPTPQPIATPTPTTAPINLPKEKTIRSSGVEINNPFLSPKRLTTQGDVLFEENATYRMVYLKQFDEFLIGIEEEPFEENRQQAEAFFLAKLGITKETACALRVTVSPPKKEGELSPSYRLSFCK